MNGKLRNGKEITIEMRKVRILQKTSLVPVEQSLRAIEVGGYDLIQ